MTGRYWGIIAAYVIMQFSGYVTIPLLYTAFSITPVEANIFGQILGFVLVLVAILILLKPVMKERPSKDAAGPGKIVLWSVLGVFLAYFVNAITGTIEYNLFGIEEESQNTMMIVDWVKMVPIFFIVPAFIAPILEEIVFRQIIFGSLYKRFNFLIAAIVSAGIFGIIHQEPEHLLIYSGMGLVFAFLYVKTKRIIVPILVHMTLNTISVLLQVFGVIEKLQEKLDNMEKTLQIILGG